MAILWVITKLRKPPTNPRKVSPQSVDSQLGVLQWSESESRGWILKQQTEGRYANSDRVYWT